METLYPIFYGTRLVTFDVIEATFKPRMHPEAWRRASNFMVSKGGKFGPGGGYRADGEQPDLPGFAPEGESFHQLQKFPSGIYYMAWDWVVRNPGFRHRAPHWDEVPAQGSSLAIAYGYHMNVGTPGTKGSEPWHGQGIEIDGWRSWVNAGRPDLQYNYPILIGTPPPPVYPPSGPVVQPSSKEIIVQFNSRTLIEGAVGNDVKFYQERLNDIAGQGLLLDGKYGPRMTQAVKNFQTFFGKTKSGQIMIPDGKLGAITQQGIIEVSLATG